MTNRTITFGLVNHNQNNLIQSLLNNLNNFDQEISFRVALIDNIPPGIEINPENYYFPIKYFQNITPSGFSANINKAFDLEGSNSEFFCILNPDVEFDQSIFPLLFEALDKLNIDIISPLVLDSNGVIQDSFRPFPTPISLIRRNITKNRPVIQASNLDDTIYPDWIAGLFMLMPASVFKQLGGLNNEYKLYFEDVEFCLRANQFGYKIGVIKSAQIIHDAQRTSHKSFLYLMLHIRSALRFFSSPYYKKHRKSVSLKK